MNIPHGIIKKALKGGWHKIWKIEWHDDAPWAMSEEGPVLLRDEETVLDSDFWMALGIDGLEFCRLILRKASQEEITKFWKAL